MPDPEIPENMPNIQLYAALEQVIQKARFGTVSLSVQIHEGKAVYLIGNNFEHRQYKEDGTTKAIEEFLMRIKDTRVKGKTGSCTATFKFQAGSVKELLIQSNFKNHLGP